MSAMIRPVELPAESPVGLNNARTRQAGNIFEGEWAGLDPIPASGGVTVFETGSGERLWPAADRVRALQAEVATLRSDLHEAERTIVLLEQLLRNTQIRERELRRELVEEAF